MSARRTRDEAGRQLAASSPVPDRGGDDASVGGAAPLPQGSPESTGSRATSVGMAALAAQEKERRRVLFTFSGGLVAACMLRWLLLKGYEVLCLVSDLGQRGGCQAAAALAERLGASQVFKKDLKQVFLKDFVLPTLQANAQYECRDPLGLALSRYVIAREQIALAAREGCRCVAHGARANSNDQCRFELTYYALNPDITVLVPLRDAEFLSIAKSRSSLLDWYGKQGLPPLAGAEEWSQDWSEDDNIYEVARWGGVLDNPAAVAPRAAWQVTAEPLGAPAVAEMVTIEFRDGLPVKVTDCRTGESQDRIVQMFETLNEMGSRHGIGRGDVVTNRVIGVKSRRLYECPAGTILQAAHKDIENVAMDREVMRIRDMFSPKFAELVHNGFWFSPEMDFITAAVMKSQEVINGTVTMRLLRGSAVPVRRRSEASLFATELAGLGLDCARPQDVEGYIRIQALRLKAHAAIMDNIRGSESGQDGASLPVGRDWKRSEQAGYGSYQTFWDNVAGRP